MDDAKQQLADKLKAANNVLVTVSRDPSVDQLSALLGLTLLLNKQGKHAAAVYSGHTPSTIEFLQPEETIEKNTDSLRDFIIALDKNKADKLRYKVEDDVVRIFITPYKTSITEGDFEFSEGDFNVDVVVALGVGRQEDLDEAITAHGRILHDATVTSINTVADGGLGTINWHEPQSSSLSQLVTELAQELGSNLLDEQIATALLTGIVSETDRFSNDKTSSGTMSASAILMAAGANQQLVASKLEEPTDDGVSSSGNNPDDGDDNTLDQTESPPADDGTIDISHDDTAGQPDVAADQSSSPPELPDSVDETVTEPPLPEPNPTEQSQPPVGLSLGSKLIIDPPTMGGTLTANSSQPTTLDPATDPLSLLPSEPPQLLKHDTNPPPITAPLPSLTPPPSAWVPTATQPPDLTPDVSEPPAVPVDPTLSQLEESVNSPHVEPAQLDSARDEVDRALNSASATDSAPPTPIQALNAQPLGDDLHPTNQPAPADDDADAPPPVPPPIPFQFGPNPL